MVLPKLDHIVILLPISPTPEALLRAAEPFTHHFSLSPGGFHVGGQSQNVLISLADGVYLELIAFTSHDTAPGRRWVHGRSPTRIVDFAFLGRPAAKGAYEEGQRGGRGECRWVVTVPKEDEWGVGTLPFWCGDVTPREWRVPKPKEHPSGIKAVKKITVLVNSEEQRERIRKEYRTLGCEGDEIQVGTPSGKNVQIDVRLAESDEEKKALRKDGGGIYKVEFDIPGVVLSNSDL
jgi:hypothetical protein